MTWIATTAGVLLVLATLVDIYLTVLYPRSGPGFFSQRLYNNTWRLFRALAHVTNKGNHWLLHCGPVLLIGTVAIWVCVLWFGFALIYWPQLGDFVRSSDGPTSPSFGTALYFSGFNLTTLGTGDIVPKSDFYRILTVIEAMIGFSVITLSLTYFLSVYNALVRRNTFAMSLHHRTAGTGDAAELIVRGITDDDCDTLRQSISEIATGMANLFESHHSYPVLHYFRFPSPVYAMARIALVALDYATLIRTALDEKKYATLINSAAVAELGGVGNQMLTELFGTLMPGELSDENIGSAERQWRARYGHALAQLKAANIATVTNQEAGAAHYIELRRQWHPYVCAFAEYMKYEWDEIAPVSDRMDTADEKQRKNLL